MSETESHGSRAIRARLDHPVIDADGHIIEFLPAVREMISKYELSDVLVKCEQAELPFSPIAHPEDLFHDEQLLQSGSLIPTTLPNGDQTQLPSLPFRLESFNWAESASLPTYAEHTQEVLSHLGYAQDAIELMKNEGVVG